MILNLIYSWFAWHSFCFIRRLSIYICFRDLITFFDTFLLEDAFDFWVFSLEVFCYLVLNKNHNLFLTVRRDWVILLECSYHDSWYQTVKIKVPDWHQRDEKYSWYQPISRPHVPVHMKGRPIKSHCLVSGKESRADVIEVRDVKINTTIVIEMIIFKCHTVLIAVTAMCAFGTHQRASAAPVFAIYWPQCRIYRLFCQSASAVLAIREQVKPHDGVYQENKPEEDYSNQQVRNCFQQSDCEFFWCLIFLNQPCTSKSYDDINGLQSQLIFAEVNDEFHEAIKVKQNLPNNYYEGI